MKKIWAFWAAMLALTALIVTIWALSWANRITIGPFWATLVDILAPIVLICDCMAAMVSIGGNNRDYVKIDGGDKGVIV
jgi:hypothetical protein